MPVYEYYCRSCQSKFELLRPMKMATIATNCPSGHEGATRTISVFAAIGHDELGQSMPLGGGGCACGGACACGGH
ncbi:MAG TPA: zinc ribbon domain-containing protein [Dehalococcoidia bacterium]|nr:zinc ribbon domain-containing protein [Dehalococcoidia bacterium]